MSKKLKSWEQNAIPRNDPSRAVDWSAAFALSTRYMHHKQQLRHKLGIRTQRALRTTQKKKKKRCDGLCVHSKVKCFSHKVSARVMCDTCSQKDHSNPLGSAKLTKKKKSVFVRVHNRAQALVKMTDFGFYSCLDGDVFDLHFQIIFSRYKCQHCECCGVMLLSDASDMTDVISWSLYVKMFDQNTKLFLEGFDFSICSVQLRSWKHQSVSDTSSLLACSAALVDTETKKLRLCFGP